MRRPHLSALTGLAFAMAVAAAGCRPSVPSGFIPEADMEDILYDYHLAESMARQGAVDYESTLSAYRTAILKKYGVSEADFDTSMVFYMRHTQRLSAIYKRIAERMEDRARALGSSEGMLAGLGRASASGDTVDIWKGEKSVTLLPQIPYNLYSFSLKPDSAFRHGDSFVLSTYSDFIFQDGIRDGIAALALVYRNDSVASRIIHISSTGRNTLTLADPDSLGIKQIKGYFLLSKGTQPGTSSTLRLMALSDIRLFRCRRSKKTTDPHSKDTPLPGDSMSRERKDIATPDEDTPTFNPVANACAMSREPEQDAQTTPKKNQ